MRADRTVSRTVKLTMITAVAAAALAFAGTAQASFLVYVCGGNLCRINPDGNGQTQLTTNGQQGTSQAYAGPSLSRDGSKLAFVFNFQVIVADANAAHRGTPFATTALLALMRPDGGAVAELEETFTSPPIQICTYGVNGSGRNCPYGTASAGWAPDNNLLITEDSGMPPDNQRICHVPAGGPSSSPCDVKANDPTRDLYDPAVSPDGSTLAVTATGGVGGSVRGHIALYNYATGQFKRNLTAGTNDSQPVWSPDGKQLAFQRGGSIDVIGAGDPAGSERQLVANGSQPTWGGPTSPPLPRPHGTRIAKAKINKKKHKATFRFTAAGTIKGFQCELIKPKRKHHKRPRATFKPCRSGKTYKHLKKGRYTFKVRAVNSTGPDPKPAVRKFKI